MTTTTNKDDLINLLKQLKTQLDAEREKCLGAQRERDAVMFELMNERARRETLESEARSSAEQMRTMARTIADQATRAHGEEETVALRTENERLASELRRCTNDRDESAAGFQFQLRETSIALGDVNKKLETLQQEHNDMLAFYQAENANLTKQLEVATTAKEELARKIATAAVEERNNGSANLDEIARLKSSLESTERRLAQAEEAVSRANEASEAARRETQSFHARLGDQETRHRGEIEALEQEFMELKRSKEEEIAQTREEAERRHAEARTQLETDLGAIRAEMRAKEAEFSEAMKTKEGEIEKLKRKVEDDNARFETLRLAHEKEMADLRKAKDEEIGLLIKSKEEAIQNAISKSSQDRLESERRAASEVEAKYEADRQRLREEIESLRKSRDDLQKRHEDETTRLVNEHAARQRQEMEESLQKRKREEETALEAWRREAETARQALVAERDATQEALRGVKERMRERDEEIARLTSSLASLEEEKTREVEELESMVASLKANEQRGGDDVRSARAEVEALGTRLRECETEIEELRLERDLRKREFEQEIARLKASLEERTGEMRKATDELSAASARLTKMKLDYQNELEAKAKYQARAEEAEESVKRVNEEISGVREELARARRFAAEKSGSTTSTAAVVNSAQKSPASSSVKPSTGPTTWTMIELDDTVPLPTHLTLDSPVIQTILKAWTKDEANLNYFNAWCAHLLSGKDVQNGFQKGIEISKVNASVKDGLVNLVVPLLKTRPDVEVGVYLRDRVEVWYDVRLKVSPVMGVSSSSQNSR